MKLIHSLIHSFIHSFIFARPLHQFPARIAGHPHLVRLAINNMFFNTPDIDASSEARICLLTGVSGQRPEQGADAKFLRSRKRGHKALTLHSEFLSLSRFW
jgi:hypothetical protein